MSLRLSLLLFAPVLLIVGCAEPDPERPAAEEVKRCPDAATPSPPDITTNCPANSLPQASVQKTYEISLINGHNGCNFPGWEGGITTGARLTTSALNGALSGGLWVPGDGAGLPVPVPALRGTTDGESFALAGSGAAFESGGCRGEWRVSLEGRSTPQSFTGTLTYHTQLLHGAPGCEGAFHCSSIQLVTGGRSF